MNKISEMEEAFEKNTGRGRPKKGTEDDTPTRGLSRGNQKKVNEFMADLRGVMVSEDWLAVLDSKAVFTKSFSSLQYLPIVPSG